MPTVRGTPNAETALSPQQALDKVTSLITERGDESPPPDETPEPDASPAPTQPEPAPQPSDPEPPATDEADTQEYEVVVDGETISVPLSELKGGYRREADYTRKTQALARERDALRSQLEAEVQASVGAKAQEYQQGVTQLRQALEKINGEPNWVELHKTLEPGEFLKQKADWEASKAEVDAWRRHEADITEQNQRAQAEQFAKYRRQEQDALLAKIPEWQDGEKAKAEHAKMIATAKQYGYTEQEIYGVVDHRPLLILRDAMRWRELHREPNASTKVKASGIKTAKPGTPDRPRPNADWQKKLERVAKTGSQRDAMAAIMDLIPD